MSWKKKFTAPKGGKTMRRLSPEESSEWLGGLIAEHSREIAEARVASNGIVFLLQNPVKDWCDAFERMGFPRPGKDVTVFGLACDEAARKFGTDPVTRRWCEAPPVDGETKLFFIAGYGSALFTHRTEVDADGKRVGRWTKEPDIYPVK